MKTRRKRLARPKRSTSRQRFRMKAPRLPKLQVPSRQQRELAGIGFFALAALITLAVALPTGGSVTHLLRDGVTGLFGWGVVFVIGACLAAGIELLAPWIEAMTWGRGLGLALVLLSALGLLHLSAQQSGGAVGRAEAEEIQALVGTAGSILVLTAVLLGGLVLAFDISLRAMLDALRQHYLASRPQAKPEPKRVQPETWHPRNQVIRSETSEPMLVPIQGVAAPVVAPVPPVAPPAAVAVLPRAEAGANGDLPAEKAPRRKRAALAEDAAAQPAATTGAEPAAGLPERPYPALARDRNRRLRQLGGRRPDPDAAHADRRRHRVGQECVHQRAPLRPHVPGQPRRAEADPDRPEAGGVHHVPGPAPPPGSSRQRAP